MSNPADYRPAPGTIPENPGVYRFRDTHGRVIYVGKAKNLRSRLSSYFAELATLTPKTASMVTTATSVDWVVVDSEFSALQLEYSWIKEYDPRFNIRYKDDKSYPFLAVTLDEEYPRVQVMRGAKKQGVRYFGPYTHAWAIRETVDLLLRVFPVRTCSATVFKRAKATDRPCLLGYIDRCSAPCVGRVTAQEHRRIVDDFVSFMSGQSGRFAKDLEAQMRSAAADMDFEKAARLRDDIRALEKVSDRNIVVLPDGYDVDVIGLVADELQCSVQVFHVRDGRVRGQRGFVSERVEDATMAELTTQLLLQMYAENADVPKEIHLEYMPDDEEGILEFLAELRGSKVVVRVPQRGDRRTLLDTVLTNATQTLALVKLKRGADLTSRSQALAELQEYLGLREAPLRMECIDISHLQGTDVVGSLVVFEDGIPRTSQYRKFAIREPIDDVRSIREVVTRRFKRYLEDRERPVDEGRFAYPPSLLVVDGAKPQADAAREVLDSLGLHEIDVVGLAKRLEEVWLPHEDDPLIMPRNSEGLFMLQRIRDEAHRSAISYHRQKRSRRSIASVLDEIPGLGEVRRKALLKHFGSVRRLRAATEEEIASVPGIGPATAAAIVQTLAATAEQTSGAGSSGGEVTEEGERGGTDDGTP